MSKEKIDTENKNENQFNFDDLKKLSPQEKMRILLEIFDLGPNPKENEERKNNFIDLMGEYFRSGIKERTENLRTIKDSDLNKKRLHNQIMRIIRNMSLSRGLRKDQERLTEYLVRNRNEVEKIIEVYFLGYDPSEPKEQSILKQALRGTGPFISKPDKDDN
jgi:hypothetical protein